MKNILSHTFSVESNYVVGRLGRKSVHLNNSKATDNFFFFFFFTYQKIYFDNIAINILDFNYMVINNLFHFSTFEAFHCTFYFNTFEALHCHFWTQVFTSAHKLPYLTRLWFTNCVTVANIKWAAHRFINPIWLYLELNPFKLQ